MRHRLASNLSSAVLWLLGAVSCISLTAVSSSWVDTVLAARSVVAVVTETSPDPIDPFRLWVVIEFVNEGRVDLRVEEIRFSLQSNGQVVANGGAVGLGFNLPANSRRSMTKIPLTTRLPVAQSEFSKSLSDYLKLSGRARVSLIESDVSLWLNVHPETADFNR